MTTLTFAIICAAVFGWLLLHLTYWHLVRPVALLSIQFRMERLYDELRLAALRDRRMERIAAFPIVLGRLRRAGHCAGGIGVTDLFRAIRQNPTASLEHVREKETIEHAGGMIDATAHRANRLAVAAVAINSPFFWYFAPVIVIVSLLSVRAERKMDEAASTAAAGDIPDAQFGDRRPAFC